MALRIINPASIYAILRTSDRSQNAARFAGNGYSIGKKRNKVLASV
ncbi:hypothetical protein [Thiolapillus sp.]